ncbi:MAG: hypothetical protein VW576_09430, partial [Opitutae bacterium]
MKIRSLRSLAYASCAYALITGSLFAQTVVPPGLGALSSTQPSRGTAVLTAKLTSTGGQNPTVKIRWGDEDRGTAVTPSIAWDNEVTISTNQAAGSFSTTITIPNLDKIYYFRAVADNAGGAVVSRSLGVLLPDAPVGVENLQGRWDFNGQNADDSSGMTNHGTAKKLFAPSEISNLSLWLDGSDSSTITHTSNAVAQWADKSGNNYHATQETAANKPTLNGKSIEFDGSNDFLSLAHGVVPDSDEASMVFIVSRIDNNSSQTAGLLHNGSTTNGQHYSYRYGTGLMVWAYGGGGMNYSAIGAGIDSLAVHAIERSVSGSSVKLYLNGTLKQTLSDYNGTANAGSQTGFVGRTDSGNAILDGLISEILVYKTEPSDANRQKIEGYLAHKWGIYTKLPSSHPHELGAPLAASGTPDYITDTPFGSGKAIDLKDGHVEIPTGESEDDFDGGSSFSVSAWVKGWPAKSMDTIVSKGGVLTADPSSASGMIAWFDAADSFTFDKGSFLGETGIPEDGEVIGFMLDKSGSGNHATKRSGESPKYQSSGFNVDFPRINTDVGNLEITNTSITDGLTGMTIALALEWQGTGSWKSVLANSAANGGFDITTMNVGANQGTGLWFLKSDSSGNDRLMSGSADARPGSPKILSYTYSAGTWKLYAGGVLRHTKTNGLTALGTNSANVRTGSDHSIAEIIMYKEALSDND